MNFETEWRLELGPEAGPPRKRPGYELPFILGRKQAEALAEQSLTLRVIYSTGIRPRELADLKPDQILYDRIQLKNRTIPIEPRLAEQVRSQPLEPSTYENPQALRHAFATHKIEDGMDVVRLHHILGNENPSTTMQYLHTAVALHAPAYFRCHPLAEKRAEGPEPKDPPGDDEPDEDEDLPPHVGTPTVEETRALIDAPVLRLYYATGLRRNELLNLRHQDLNRDENRVFVRHGKEDKDRYVLLDPGTTARLPTGSPQDKIFDYTPRQIDEFFHQTVVRSGLLPPYQERGETLTLHCLRRAYATHCYLNGMPLQSLKSLMGHGQLTTTAMYLQCPFEHCQAQYQPW